MPSEATAPKKKGENHLLLQGTTTSKHKSAHGLVHEKVTLSAHLETAGLQGSIMYMMKIETVEKSRS